MITGAPFHFAAQPGVGEKLPGHQLTDWTLALAPLPD
jgi:hypothetical protein